jgi:hypothetical protein
MTAIKDKKLLRVSVMECAHDAAPQIFTGPGGAEPFAFNTQERDFVERIDHSQARIEFQTVNDSNRIAEANVFGAQVSMPVDDPPRSHALGQKFGPLGQEPTLHSVDVAHGSGWNVKAWVEKHTAIIGKAAP